MPDADDAFAFIPAGWFDMGSDDGADDEQPVHRVWVDAFEPAVFPVTCRAYRRFLDATWAIARMHAAIAVAVIPRP